MPLQPLLSLILRVVMGTLWMTVMIPHFIEGSKVSQVA